MNNDEEIDTLLNNYNKQSSTYPFAYTFYNLSHIRNRPVNFPPNEWAVALQKAPSIYHTPFILKGFDELDERVRKQNDIISSINDSEDGLNRRVDEMNIRLGVLRGSVNELVKKCRERCNVSGDGERVDEIQEKLWKIKEKMKRFDGEMLICDNEKIEDVLWIFKRVGEKLREDVEKEFGKGV
ncbi:Nucleoporin nup57, partial [Conglomerata obtusa]